MIDRLRLNPPTPFLFRQKNCDPNIILESHAIKFSSVNNKTIIFVMRNRIC